MPESSPTHHGHCLCGKISYRIESPAGPTSLCHCEDCRRASGAPAVAWTFFPSGTLHWNSASPRVVLHAGRERSFCPDCGTPLTFFDPEIPGQFEVTTCSLEHPEDHLPVDHNWESDRIPWFDPLPHIPRYKENSPAPLG